MWGSVCLWGCPVKRSRLHGAEFLLLVGLVHPSPYTSQLPLWKVDTIADFPSSQHSLSQSTKRHVMRMKQWQGEDVPQSSFVFIRLGSTTSFWGNPFQSFLRTSHPNSRGKPRREREICLASVSKWDALGRTTGQKNGETSRYAVLTQRKTNGHPLFLFFFFFQGICSHASYLVQSAFIFPGPLSIYSWA